MTMFPSSTALLWLAVLVAPAHAPDACSLINQEDAAAALGEGATGPKATAEMSDGAGSTVSGCEYTGSGINRVQLNLTHMPKNAIATYKGMCKQTSDLAGIGEQACWYNEKHEELHAIKGEMLVSIELRRKGDPTEPIKAMMRKAVGRLK